MNKTQRLKNALEAFQSNSADTPILLSVTQHNDKAFKALLGRKAKSKPVHYLEWVLAGVVFIIGLGFGFFMHNAFTGGGFGGLFAMLYIIYLNRYTLIAAGEGGVDFYYTERKFASKDYIVYDKVTIPYDKITNLKVKRGRFNTTLRFQFPHDGKTIKMITSVYNKKRHLEEQENNLSSFLKKVESLQVS